MELSRFCTQKLEETERRVTILMKDSGGNVVEKPFAPREDEGTPG
jgi:exonuclease VII small subunit